MAAMFDNEFEALNLPLIIILCLCSRNLPTWQWHSAPLQNTEFWLEFCHGWPLVISITSCKVQMLYSSSLCWQCCVVISAEAIHIASHLSLYQSTKHESHEILSGRSRRASPPTLCQSMSGYLYLFDRPFNMQETWVGMSVRAPSNSFCQVCQPMSVICAYLTVPLICRRPG